MKEEIVGFKFILFFAILISGNIYSQTFVSEGRIEFERKTNLEKRFAGMDDNPWMRNVDLSKPKIDKFELFFNDTSSVFQPIKTDLDEGMSAWLTMKNTSHQDIQSGMRKQKFSFFGTDILLQDSLRNRTWRITQSKREIAGYSCRQALWEMNDSIKIYAWYAEELIPSLGPETFNGLPGVILGLATEDGGVVYFAKKVEIGFNGSIEKMAPQGKPKDWYTEETLTQLVKERFSGRGSFSEGFLLDLFMW